MPRPFQLGPERVVVRMVQVALLEEHRPDERGAEARDLAPPAAAPPAAKSMFCSGTIAAAKSRPAPPCRNRRSSCCRPAPAHTPRPGLAPDRSLRRTRWDRAASGPPPSRPCRAGGPGGPTRPSFIACRVCGSSSPIASQVMPGRQMAWRGSVGVHRVAEHLAIDLEVGAGPPLFAPQRMFAQRAVFRLQILLPDVSRLDHVGVAVKHRKSSCVVMTRAPLLSGSDHAPSIAWYGPRRCSGGPRRPLA